MFVGGLPDPFIYPLQSSSKSIGEPINLDIYTQVSLPKVSGQSTVVILIYGQSLPSNYVNSNYTVTQSNSHMFNPINGGMYRTKEPIVGTNGGRYGYPGVITGNATSRLGDLLIAAGAYDRVILCNICAGGTTSARWANGDCTDRLRVAGKRMVSLGIEPDFVIRDQGTSDTNNSVPAATFTANIRTEVEVLRSVGVDAPVLVNKSAWNGSASVGTTAYNNIRTGVDNALSSGLGIYAGFDTDTIGASSRFDGIHFNSTGASTFATGLKNLIVGFTP